MTTFISYSRANSDFAIRLARDLKGAGIDVWLDQLDIPKGARWDDELENALRNCSTFLIVLSPASINSQNVKDEIGYAIDSGKHILPVMINPCDIPIRLRRFQYIDFSNAGYEERFSEIKDILSNTARLPTSAGTGKIPSTVTPSISQPRSKKSLALLLFFGGGVILIGICLAIFVLRNLGMIIPFVEPSKESIIPDLASASPTEAPAINPTEAPAISPTEERTIPDVNPTAPPTEPNNFKVIFLGKWGSEGDGEGQFRRPWGIGVNWSVGHVYVGDDNRYDIQVFSSSGEFLGRIPGQFYANFLTLDSNGLVYALNYDPGTGINNRVEKYYFGENQMLGTFPLKGQSPRAIDTDIYGTNIYIADISDQRVYRYGTEGELLSEWGSPGSGEAQFFDPWGIAVDRYQTGRVYVADTGNNRIQVFTPEGDFIHMWGTNGVDDGQFDSPIDVAVDTSNGYVYVLDRKNARVQVFTPDGEFLGKWGTMGRGDGEFLDPYGIAIDGNDNIFVLDTGNFRVQAFRVSFVP